MSKCFGFFCYSKPGKPHHRGNYDVVNNMERWLIEYYELNLNALLLGDKLWYLNIF